MRTSTYGRATSLRGFDQGAFKLDPLEKKLAKISAFLFYSVGSFYSISQMGESIIDTAVVLLIKKPSKFTHEIQVVNQKEELFYTCIINENLNFEWNQDSSTVMWSYFDNKGQYLGLKVYLPNQMAAMNFNWVISVCLMEQANKKEIGQDAKGAGNDFYIPHEYAPEEAMAYRQFVGPEIQPKMEEEVPPVDLLMTLDDSAMRQARLLDRTCISDETGIINVFKIDEEGNFEHNVNFPEIKKFNGDVLNPRDILFLEGDTKMVISDKKDRMKAFLVDVDKSKVVSELGMDPKRKMEIESICSYEKHSEFDPNPNFYAMNQEGIGLFDPRNKNFPVDWYFYSSNPHPFDFSLYMMVSARFIPKTWGSTQWSQPKMATSHLARPMEKSACMTQSTMPET